MKIFRFLLFWFLPFMPLFSQETTSLDSLISFALRNHPLLKAARLETAAGRARIRQAGSWNSPQIGVEFYQTPIHSFPDPFKNQMEYDYSIQQMIPFPGKRTAMKTASKNAADMLEQNAFAVERNLIKEIKTTYYELHFIRRKIGINRENREQVDRFVGLASKRYEVGMGTQADMLRVQGERTKLISEGIELEKESASAEAMLSSLIGSGEALSFGKTEWKEPPLTDFKFDDLLALAEKVRPELKAMRFGIRMAEADLSASKREVLPDLMTRLMWKDMAMTREDYWSLMVGVEVPFAFWSFGKLSGKIQENRINLEKAKQEYENMKNMVAMEIRQAMATVEAGRKILDLNRNSLIPQAEQTLQSAMAGYQTGKTDILMVLEAYRMLLMARTDEAMAMMNRMVGIAELERAVGLSTAEIEESIRSFDSKLERLP